jgi:hypothetical protein
MRPQRSWDRWPPRPPPFHNLSFCESQSKDPRPFADPALPFSERKVFRCAVFNLLDAQREGPEIHHRLDGLVVTWLGRFEQRQ